MKLATSIVGLTLMAVHCACAQSIKDPIHDYLFSPDDDSVIEMPYLKELYVLKCDLDGTGKLATIISFNGEGGRQGNYWTVYLPAKDGFVKADEGNDTFIFPRDCFFVGSMSGRNGLLTIAPGKTGGDLNLYQIVHRTVTKRKIANTDPPGDSKTLERYVRSVPNWKNEHYDLVTMSVSDLEKAGYNAEAAIRAAEASNRPLTPPIGN